MTTFHPFPRLPYELRAQIWEMTVEPRTVDVQIVHKGPRRDRHLISSTPVPATLQSCREARNLGLYQPAFSELSFHQGTEQRYVWLNLDIDLVSIGRSYFGDFLPVASTIRRLKFVRENGDEFFYHSECRELKTFVNAEEMHVVCADGFWMWAGVINEGCHPWPCAIENLFFFDLRDGRTARGIELEEIIEESLKEEWAASGYDYPSLDPIS